MRDCSTVRGVYLQVHGRPAQARPLMQRALAIDEAIHGPDHPTIATRLNNLATLLRDLGEPEAARLLTERPPRTTGKTNDRT